ncbi:sec7 domain-containing protein [Ophiostoma piceae UAMH 11346]|uniref:Sec7 domain-containing protein n=1 Tax=Ophiostoma piceae (strain UAMH 11346) TaxID=1262450 RepID=S3CRG1_OPHP1|nr:sec7 domain-containing protein [Ophiostoma piceae UAMH 11346]
MNSDSPRRSSRRRPELSVNTSRSRSSTKNSLPPTDSFAGSLSRSSSRGARTTASNKPSATALPIQHPRTTPALGTSVMSSSMDLGGPSRSRAPSTSHHNTDSDTFLDMYTPVGAPKENRNPLIPEASSSPPMFGQRDSHDLSLPSRHVRDSLVSNMLLSLDQFSMGQMSVPSRPVPSFDDHRLYSLSTTATDDNIARGPSVPTSSRVAGGGGGGGHGHGRYGYNYSSDFDGPDDASRVSGSISHGRRSNSSSGFQSSLGRINSMRESSMHRGSQPGTPRMMHSRGGKGSKSSSTNSIDTGGYVQVLGSQRVAPVLPQFDLDSAPAPNIGYEKAKEVVPPATQQQQQQQQHVPAHPLREKPSFFKRMFGSLRDTVSGSEPVPPIPSPTSNPAHASSTSIETNGTRNLSSGGPKTQSTPPSRDSHHSTHATLQKKPSGFFRRRKKSISEAMPPPPLPMPMPPQQQPTPLPKDLPLVPSPAPEDEELHRPASPLKLPRSDRFVENAAPSPATSLSRAMGPYLKGSPMSPGATNDHNLDEAMQQTAASSPLRTNESTDLYDEAIEADLAARTVRGFSPDYEPPQSATIRSVDPELPAGSRHSITQRQTFDTPTRQPPAPPKPHPARTGSFLSDDSDNEDSPRLSISKTLAKHRSQQLEGTHLSPTSARGPGSKKSSASLDTEISDSRNGSKISLPIEGAVSPSFKSRSASAGVTPTSASSMHMPIVKIDTTEVITGAKKDTAPTDLIDEPEFVVGRPTEDDRLKALNIFQGNEDFITKEKAAAWMGEEGPVRQRTLQAYMDLYDFRNQSIVNSLRDVCSRLILRAETQQVDRILVCFSKRWCASNPKHSFKSMDIVHTICYSIMLLNTDLHLADIESKMTRSQFIKNTMATIVHTVSEAASEPAKQVGRRPSVDQERGLAAPHVSLPPRSESSLGHHDDCGPLVKAPFEGPMRLWESQMEIVLKIIYTSIRDERLPLFGAEGASTGSQQNQNSLSVMGMLKRTPSVLSKAPSEGQASTRGRVNDSSARAAASRWASKSRSRVRGPPALGGPNGFSSSRTSFEDASSIWSPTVSSATWSRQSLGRTQASMSMESFGSQWARGDYQQSIGFANALSQAIIREDGVGGAPSMISDDQSVHRKDTNLLLDDESLELAGPPWIKEGMVTHKHHLDGMDKKARDRNWVEVFAVVQKGQMSLFSFTPNKSLRAKNRGRNAKGAVVGGGNWQENATNLGTFSLKQTLASALPPPGYSRQRPHVWALSLPTGAVHLFHVGTPEICKEFVNTANYWSARLSTHPLVGGISNIEYGWGDSIVNNSLVSAIKSESTTALPSTSSGAAGGSGTHGPYPPSASRPGSAAAGRASIASRGSFRSGSFDFGHTRTGSASSGFTTTAAAVVNSASRHGKLPGDRIHIADWTPPTQSLRASTLAEHQQLQTLLAYVQSIEEELQVHNALRSPMLLAFTPRGHNANKAMANWERKSSHLLREIVKYRTYVDCLTEAGRRRSEIYHERDIARRAARGDGSVHSADLDGDIGYDSKSVIVGDSEVKIDTRVHTDV